MTTEFKKYLRLTVQILVLSTMLTSAISAQRKPSPTPVNSEKANKSNSLGRYAGKLDQLLPATVGGFSNQGQNGMCGPGKGCCGPTSGCVEETSVLYKSRDGKLIGLRLTNFDTSDGPRLQIKRQMSAQSPPDLDCKYKGLTDKVLRKTLVGKRTTIQCDGTNLIVWSNGSVLLELEAFQKRGFQDLIRVEGLLSF